MQMRGRGNPASSSSSSSSRERSLPRGVSPVAAVAAVTQVNGSIIEPEARDGAFPVLARESLANDGTKPFRLPAPRGGSIFADIRAARGKTDLADETDDLFPGASRATIKRRSPSG